MRSRARRSKTRSIEKPLWLQIQEVEGINKTFKQELATLRASIAAKLYQLSEPYEHEL